jgi:hypothetical protein
VFLVVACANKAREAGCDLLLSVGGGARAQVAVDEEPFLNQHLFRCLRPRLVATHADHHQEREAWAFDLHSWRAGCSKNIQVCRYSTNTGSHAPFLGHATGNGTEFYTIVETGETSWIPDMPTRAALTMSLWA